MDCKQSKRIDREGFAKEESPGDDSPAVVETEREIGKSLSVVHSVTLMRRLRRISGNFLSRIWRHFLLGSCRALNKLFVDIKITSIEHPSKKLWPSKVQRCKSLAFIVHFRMHHRGAVTDNWMSGGGGVRCGILTKLSSFIGLDSGGIVRSALLLPPSTGPSSSTPSAPSPTLTLSQPTPFPPDSSNKYSVSPRSIHEEGSAQADRDGNWTLPFL
ncbi:hypothetical protein LguiB_026904 [Lonicera macranthoides]